MSDAGRLLITQGTDATLLEGVVGASRDLMAVVGTVKEASAPVVTEMAQLERAIVEAAQSGKMVMDGYIKFAKPITVKGPTSAHVKQASNAVATLDDNGLLDFIEKLSHLESTEDGKGIEKLAACDFVNNWINKIELDKVDGSEIGLTAPVKVAFADDKAKEWFLSLFNKKAGHEKTAAESMAERLVSMGVSKIEMVEKLAKVAARRRGKVS